MRPPSILQIWRPSMFTLASFDEIAGIGHSIEITNPAMVARIRRVADTLNRYEIAARLADAITDAADAAPTRAFEDAQFGAASAAAIVYCAYYAHLAAARSLVPRDPPLTTPHPIFPHHGH